MKSFVDEFGLTEFEHIADGGGSIWHAFQITAQPSFVFIGEDGTVRRHIGALDLSDLVEELDLLIAS